MAHALDFEDAFDAAPTHPNASLLPAAFALSESQGAVSGYLSRARAAGISWPLPEDLDDAPLGEVRLSTTQLAIRV